MSVGKEVAAVERARTQLAEAHTALNEKRKRRKIACGGCTKLHAIGKLELLITHFYIQPQGCSEGDYWLEGEWQFVCPLTCARNRLLFDDYNVRYEDRDKIYIAAEPTFKMIYRGLFASRRDIHKDDDPSKPHCNNYYVDEHRKRFELPEKSALEK